MDILMSGCYSFTALEILYQGFSRPGAKVKVNGLDIIGVPGFQVTNIKVGQSISMAGTATFSLVDCYDRVKHSFNSQINAVMMLGSKVEISLGYCSIYTKVFKGYISNIKWQFDVEQGATCSITCMDARKLMMEDYPYEYYKEGSFRSIVETIVKPYKSLCKADMDSAITDKTEMTLRPDTKTSIYEFINREFVKKGTMKKEFFILGDILYYRLARKQVLPIMNLRLGSGLLSFERSADYVNKKLEVVGQDTEKQQPVKFKTVAMTLEPQVTIVQNKHTIVEARSIDVADAAKIAIKQALQLAQKSIEGSANCIGMPQIVPGRFIMISDLDSKVNGLHYITSATHSLSMSGYTTSIKIGGE